MNPLLVGAMDFGWRSPRVMLWAHVMGEGNACVAHVIDEDARQRVTLDAHLDAIAARGWGRPAWIGIDPAGLAGNGQTGRSDAQVLRRRGYGVRAATTSVREGVEAIRAMLDHDRLFIHPRCRGLIDAVQRYHFDAQRPQRQEPVKDGPDHWCDALRYLVMNLRRGAGVVRRNYLCGS